MVWWVVCWWPIRFDWQPRVLIIFSLFKSIAWLCQSLTHFQKSLNDWIFTFIIREGFILKKVKTWWLFHHRDQRASDVQYGRRRSPGARPSVKDQAPSLSCPTVWRWQAAWPTRSRAPLRRWWRGGRCLESNASTLLESRRRKTKE